MRVPEALPLRRAPPIVHERPWLTNDGKVLYRFKRAFRDGSSHVVLHPLTFVGLLAALVPRPRVHLVTYHGMFAPAAPWSAGGEACMRCQHSSGQEHAARQTTPR